MRFTLTPKRDFNERDRHVRHIAGEDERRPIRADQLQGSIIADSGGRGRRHRSPLHLRHAALGKLRPFPLNAAGIWEVEPMRIFA
jgi:hypothetical protein